MAFVLIRPPATIEAVVPHAGPSLVRLDTRMKYGGAPVLVVGFLSLFCAFGVLFAFGKAPLPR